jgi:hypothetical protein
MADTHNAFISWSGERSRLAAETLKDWLSTVLQNARPPRGSVENRPCGVTSKPANGVAQDVILIYPAFS